MSVKIFKDLEGVWSFHRNFPGGFMDGNAVFTKVSASMYNFREEGLMNLDGQTHQVYREYVYQLEENSIAVFFKEEPMRLFQRLKFIPGLDSVSDAEGIHLCGLDSYKGVYKFVTSKEFILKQIVKGPSKDYQILTKFSKA